MRKVTRRLRTLTRRQLLALLAVAGLLGITSGAAATGRLGLATALLGALVIAVFVSTVQLRRRLEAAWHESRTANRLLGAEFESLRARVDRPAWSEPLAAGQRRVLAAVENERLAAADRHRALVVAVERSAREVASRQQDQTRDVEALLQLYRDLRPRAPMPPSGRWAMNAAGLLRLLSLVEQTQPKTVLELGSGTSSVWIAYALERTGGRLVSIDHAPEFAEQTAFTLAMHGLRQVAEVRHAPLQPVRVDGRDFRWYAEDAFADLSDVGLLVVDGPPANTGPVARFPALRLLESRLSARATVFLDDADRPDEQRILEQWTAATPGLARDPHFAGRHAVLSYSRC